MDIVNVNTQEVEKKLSLMRRYIFEIMIVVLCFVCGYLFFAQKGLEKDLRTYITIDKISLVQKLDLNTDVVRQNSIQLEQSSIALKDILKSIYQNKK